MIGSVIQFRICYVCGEDLVRHNETDYAQQTDLNSMPQEYSQISLWNGTRKEVCISCYKAMHECLSVYNQNMV